MTTEKTRETMNAYTDALLAFGQVLHRQVDVHGVAGDLPARDEMRGRGRAGHREEQRDERDGRRPPNAVIFLTPLKRLRVGGDGAAGCAAPRLAR
jgi:hypothetical protein